MEQRHSGRKIRLFCVAVSALFIALTAWLYYREDLYIKTMILKVEPDGGRFQVEILAEGKNVEVLCHDSGVELFVDRKTVEGKMRLLIHGVCRDAKVREPITLKVVSDSGNITEKWKYQILTGGEPEKPVLTGRANRGRASYVLSAVITTVVISLLSADIGKNKRGREAAICAGEVLDMMRQDSTMENSWKEGRRLFVLFERRKGMNVLLSVWLWLFMAFWMVHRTYRGVPFKSQAGFYGVLVVILLILALLLSRMLELSFVKILTKECCPLTAAAAFLFMGTEGLGSRKTRFVWYQNGATGLYRAGYYEEALAIARAARPLAGKRLKEAVKYVYLRLEYLCLEELGHSYEAEREKENLKKILDTSPALRKRPDIQNNLDMDNIREWMEAGELEQAEAGAQALLNRCRGGYFRLPVLGILKSIKEYMGKEGEAEILRSEILTFSPENKEVHEAMREGHLTYLPKKLTGTDKAGSAIRVMLVMGIITFIFSTAGCGHKPVPESTGVVEEETGVSVEPSTEETNPAVAQGEEKSGETEESPSSNEEEPKQPEEDNSDLAIEWASQTRDTAGFSFLCPEGWRGLYGVYTFAEGCEGIELYQKSSYESIGDGFLFSIAAYSDQSYVNLPDYEVMGYTGSHVYVMSRPTDVPFDETDPQIMKEYNEMAQEIHKIGETFTIDSPEARYDGDEFIFPASDRILIEEPDLWKLSPEHLRIARNEIYARHGRKFKDPKLQAYFDRCSWYEGTIEPEDFTEELLNEAEKENVRQIQLEQEKRGQ